MPLLAPACALLALSPVHAPNSATATTTDGAAQYKVCMEWQGQGNPCTKLQLDPKTLTARNSQEGLFQQSWS